MLHTKYFSYIFGKHTETPLDTAKGCERMQNWAEVVHTIKDGGTPLAVRAINQDSGHPRDYLDLLKAR